MVMRCCISITLDASVPRIQPFAAQSNPTESLGNPRGAALLSSHSRCEATAPQLLHPASEDLLRDITDEDQTTEFLSVELAPRDKDFIYSPEPFPELSL